MQKIYKILFLIFSFIFLFNITYANDISKISITNNILFYKNDLSNTINWYKYIKIVDKIVESFIDINDISKIKDINLKIDNYLNSLDKKTRKWKKITLILLYLKYNLLLITYNTEWVSEINKIGKLIEQVWAPKDDFKRSAINDIKWTVYYFSSSSWDDSNDWLTPETAKKTWYNARLLFNKMNPWDWILLKRWDVWNADDIGERWMQWLRYKINWEKWRPKVLSSYWIWPRPIIDWLSNQSNIKWKYIWKVNNIDVWETLVKSPSVNIWTLYIDWKRVLWTRVLDDFYKNKKWLYSHDSKNSGKLYTHIDPNKHKFEWSDATDIIIYSTDSSYIFVKNIEVKNARKSAFVTAWNFKWSEVEYNTFWEGSAFWIVSAWEWAKYKYNIIDSGQPKFNYTDGSTTYPCWWFEGLRIWASNWWKNNIEWTEIAYNTIINFGHANVAINGSWDWSPFKWVDYHHNLLKSPSLFYWWKTSIQFNVDWIKYHHNFTIWWDRNQLSWHNWRYYNNIMVNKINSPFKTKKYNNWEWFAMNDFNWFSNNILENNIFYNTPWPWIVIVWSNKWSVDNNIIRNNIFLNTWTDDLVYPWWFKDIAIYIRNDSDRKYNNNDTIIENNIIYNQKNNKKVIFIGREYDRKDKTFLYWINNEIPINRWNIFRWNIFKNPNFISAKDNDFRLK